MPTPSSPIRRLASWGVALLAMLVSTAATAQQTQRVDPPRPPDELDGSPLTWVIVVLCFAAVVGASLIPSRRGHQD
ncbi:MAG: hypothetical protein AAFR38_00160 [Planctomycetota bacterium]